MKRHNFGLGHSYGTSGNAESQNSRPTAPPHQGHATLYSSLHQVPHGSISHQMYSQSPDQSPRLDHRSSPMISSLQRNQLSSSSMHASASQSFLNRRVSLLRDIGRAGERDRDLSSTSSSESVVGFYSHRPQSQRISTPPFQTASASGSYDRPITMMGNLAHSYQQQQQQQQQQQHFNDAAELTAKQETTLKAPVNRLGPQQGHVAMSQQMVPGFQRQSSLSTTSNKPDQPVLPTGFEQKSKEDLVQAMDKVDKELSKVTAEIQRLQKRKTQLEESAKHPPEHEKEEESPQESEPKHRDLWQIIYAENRKKAESARTVLDGICPIYDMPLYNQPCDTKVFQENLKKNEQMRPKLLKFFQHRRKLSNIREKYLCAKYDQMMETWQQNTEKIENNVKRKAKEAKTREYFEKIFPEIRKQREQQERVERVGTRGDTCRSDADFADIVDGLSEQETQLHRMRHLAVVPPMLLDKEERRVVFINNNGFIKDSYSEFKESQQLDAWADHEKATFKEKYIQQPKNFHHIASFIEKKSVADCILYYYLTKKNNHFKALVRKQTLKPRKPKSGRAHTSHQHDQSGSGSKDASDKTDKDSKKDGECEVEEIKVDRPPSPRMTRARKQTMNWTEEEINKVKEGFGKHGRDFSSISRMVTNKSEQQVKNFYHNYKKKHGLDQLITDSKKKKTRTRHVTLSPDVGAAADDDTPTSSRKATESPSMEAKSKADKDKTDDYLTTEKASKDGVPSPAVTSPNTPTDANDVTITSTTQIRTRRTAALAAARDKTEATQEAQEKVQTSPPGYRPYKIPLCQQHPESTTIKRTSDKAVTSGEPVEKKVKKNERKSRNQKAAEQQVLNELAKSEAVKDVVASLSTKPMEEETEEASSEIVEQEEPPEAMKTEVERKVEKVEKLTIKLEPKRIEVKTDDKSSVPSEEEEAPSEEHDSSATCSADEESHAFDAKAKSLDTKNVSSPYGFDDDFNDSPTRIRLERARKPENSRSLASGSVTTVTQNDAPAIAKSTSNDAINLVSKPVVPPLIITSLSVDPRPRSLPPASMVPTIISSSARQTFPPSTAPIIMPVSGMDLSRPSSTPVYGDFSLKNASGVPLNPMLTTVYGQGYKQPATAVPASKTPAIVSTIPVNVRNIGDLTYTGIKTEKKSPAPSTHTSNVVVSSHSIGVDLTKGNLAKQTALNQKQIEAARSVPSPRHAGYHMIHPMAAASLSKDFIPPASSVSISSVPPVVFPRPHLDKDKQAMKERAAVLHETAIPVSSLRFTSANAKTAAVQPHYQYQAPTPVDMGHAVRHQVRVKEEPKQPPTLPVLPPRQSYSPKPNISKPRFPGAAYPMMGAVSVSGPRPPLPMEKSAPEKGSSKHITIPGGSITQGKPVFRTQLPPGGDAHASEKSAPKFVAPITTSPRAALIPGAPSPVHLEAIRKSEEEAALFAQELLSSGINPAQAAMLGIRFPPGLVLPHAPIKLEKSSESHPPAPKTFTREDLRHIGISASGAGGPPMQIDPHMLAAGSISQLPAGAMMQARQMKGKGVEENLSPRPITQRSTPPPQAKMMERKISHPLQSAQDLPLRRASPMMQQHAVESHFKEDIKRPSSASRATPERRGMPDKANLMSHHRMASNPHLHTPSKPRSAAETKPLEDHLLQTAAGSLTEQQQQQLLAAAFAQSTLLQGMPTADPLALHALFGQYRHSGALPLNALNPAAFAQGIRSYQIPGFEGLDKSRHSVLAQDYATAQQLLQQNVAAATARNLPFSVSLPVGISAQGQPISVTMSTMIPPRHSDSPASMERLNFIPQHPLTSRASPLRHEPSRTPTNPQSPLSPHQVLKGHIVSGLTSYPGESVVHSPTERRQSRSPHVASPGPDYRSYPGFPGVSFPLEARQPQPSPLAHMSAAIRHPSVSKSSHSMPDTLSAHEQNLLIASSFGGSAPHLIRQTTSPLASQSGRPKFVKQERSTEHLDSSRHPGDRQAVYRQSPDQLPRSYSSQSPSDPTRSTQRWEPRRQTGSPMDANLRPSSKPAGYSHGIVPQPSSGGQRKEAMEKAQTEQTANLTHAQQERAVNDLKTKGRTTMTTGYLIHKIIDHNIKEYAAVHQDKKSQEGGMQQLVERKSLDGKGLEVKAPDSGIDPKMYAIAAKAVAEKAPPALPSGPTRKPTLLEQSHDIITNLYRREPAKPQVAESKPITQSPSKEEIDAMGGGHRFFNVPGSHSNTSSDDHNTKRSTDVSRANIIIPHLAPLLNQPDSHIESFIRKALMTTEATSRATQSPPVAENVRQSSTHNVRVTGGTFHPEKVPAAALSAFQTNPHEAKRAQEPSRFGSSSPAPSAPPQMYSALAFRTPAAAPAKQMMPSSNISGRSVMPGSTTQTAGVASGGVYHPQSGAAPQPDRTPLPTNQYEPLSDDEN